MKILTKGILALCLSIFAIGSIAGTALDEFEKETRKKYAIKEKAYATNDIDLVLNEFYWSDSAISTGEGFDVYQGRDAMRKLFEPVIKYTVKIVPYESYVNGNMGYSWCDYHVYGVDDKNEPFEKYRILFVWEKIDGEWFVKTDMYVLGTFDNPVR